MQLMIQSLTYEQLQASCFDFNADFYYRLNGGERGRLLGVEGVCVAFYVVMEGSDHLLVSHLFVQPAYRGQGYARRLLEEAYALAERERLSFYFRIRYDNPFADFLQRFAEAHGMKPCVPARLLLINRERTQQALREEPGAHHFARMKAQVDRWEAKGVRTESYEMLSRFVRERLRLDWEMNEQGEQLPGDLPPFPEELYEPLSFVSFRGEEPMAYLTTRKVGDSLVLTGHVCYQRWQATGIAYLTLHRFIEEFVRHTEIRQVSCLLVGYNAKAWLHAEHYWLLTNPEVIEQRSYGKQWELSSEAQSS